MIQPGKKLKDGDYFHSGTIEQYEELFKIERSYPSRYNMYSGISKIKGFIMFNGNVLSWNVSNLKTEYTFTDFRQLCVNTFGDGN